MKNSYEKNIHNIENFESVKFSGGHEIDTMENSHNIFNVIEFCKHFNTKLATQIMEKSETVQHKTEITVIKIQFKLHETI